MQASNSGGVTLDKRYSPNFKEQDNNRQGHNSSKRKREDVLRFVFRWFCTNCIKIVLKCYILVNNKVNA